MDLPCRKRIMSRVLSEEAGIELCVGWGWTIDAWGETAAGTDEAGFISSERVTSDRVTTGDDAWGGKAGESTAGIEALDGSVAGGFHPRGSAG
jgi:hypothetical protein